MCTTFNHVIFKMNKISQVSFLICLVEFLPLFFILLGCYMYLEVTILVVRKTHSYLNFFPLQYSVQEVVELTKAEIKNHFMPLLLRYLCDQS